VYRVKVRKWLLIKQSKRVKEIETVQKNVRSKALTALFIADGT